MSAAGVAGQAAEQARLGVARQRHREELARLLVRGSPAGDLAQAAERAGWRPPETLTAVATPRRRRATAVTAWTDPRALDVPDDAVPPSVRSYSTALIPGVGGRAREPFITSLSIPGTVIGPARPWMHVDTSVRRLSRAIVLNLPHTGVIDTERYLPELVLSADTEALADLRADVLAPLQSLTPAARNRLTETLRSWLLNHGRREDIGADLYVHPSTVRYRVRQLRELFGDRLHDSRAIMELTIALATPPPPKP
jgi:DNA-binding PucR family transcriptional regulator